MNSFCAGACDLRAEECVCEKSSFARWGWIISHLYPLLTPWAVFFRRFAARNRWPCSTPNLQRRSHAHAEAPTLFAYSGAARLGAAPFQNRSWHTALKSKESHFWQNRQEVGHPICSTCERSSKKEIAPS